MFGAPLGTIGEEEGEEDERRGETRDEFACADLSARF